MAFENLTFFELHLHQEGEDVFETPTPERTASDPEPSANRRLQLMKVLAMVGVSIGVSVGVTIAVKRLARKLPGRGASQVEDTESEAVVEIAE